MFSRKSVDVKKHPFRTKGTKSPKPHKKESVKIFMKEMDDELDALRMELSHYFEELEY